MKRRLRTSQTDPIRVDAVVLPGGGRIGMTFCPGKVDPMGAYGSWRRDLVLDLKAIQQWGAERLISLVESHELVALQVAELGQEAQQMGLQWHHLPIRDAHAPDYAFMEQWHAVRDDLHRGLDGGGALVVHCRGGLGRAGTVTALLLIERGLPVTEAIAQVRSARRGAIETEAQVRFLQEVGGGLLV